MHHEKNRKKGLLSTFAFIVSGGIRFMEKRGSQPKHPMWDRVTSLTQDLDLNHKKLRVVRWFTD